MADEFQAEVCGGNWWNPSRSMFGSSPCSSVINDLGGFGWPGDLLDMKARSGDESGSASDGSIVIQDMQKPNQPDSASGSSGLSMDSSLQILGIGLSSSSTGWNRASLHGNGRSETNYPTMMQEAQNSSMNYRQETGVDCPDQIQKDWTLKNFSTLIEDSSINSFKSANQDFSLHQKPLNSIPSSAQCTATCQGLSTEFPISSVSYGYSSTLLQTLFDTDPQPQQSLYGNRSMTYPASANYQTNLNEFLPSLAKFSPLSNSSLPQQQTTNHLQISKNTNFRNDSAPALNDFRSNLFASQSPLLSPTFNEKPSLPNLTVKPSNEEVQGLGSVAKKTSSEPAFKRPRIETPSPLPTFKVRKEKLGDRITALQQLVSPFGKTDTASVLHEAIEYIKFLHDQVLSTPYLRNGSPIQRQQTCDIKTKDQEGSKQDLKSRGLCLVPISSTFPVAAESTTDFWTPTFGGTFR